MRSEYPQYYQVEDLQGEVFALVCLETETAITVIQKRDARKSFTISKVSSEDEVKMLAPGQVLGSSPDDYSKILYKDWGFSLSDAVLNSRQSPLKQDEFDVRLGREQDKAIIQKAIETFDPENTTSIGVEKEDDSAETNKPDVQEETESENNNEDDIHVHKDEETSEELEDTSHSDAFDNSDPELVPKE